MVPRIDLPCWALFSGTEINPKIWGSRNFSSRIDFQSENTQSSSVSGEVSEAGKSHVTQEKSHVTQEKSHVTQKKSHVTQEKSHVTQEKSHVTQEKSHTGWLHRR